MISNFLTKKKNASTDAVDTNPNVVNLLAASVFEDSKKTCMVGDTHRSISYIRDYDPLIDINWGDVLFNRKGSITSFVCRPSDPARLRSAINHSDARQGMTLAEGSSASKMDEADRMRDHGRTMLKIMGDAGEKFFDTAILQTLNEESEENLRTATNNMRSLAAGRNFTIESCTRYQEGAFWAASPYWIEDKRIWQRYGRDMCTSSLIASGPLSDNSLDDGVGTTLGWCEPDHSMCRVDMTKPSEERPNCNIYLGGASGYGKTYTAQKIIASEWAQGARVMVIDPERQFSKFARNTFGQWIDAGGGCTRSRDGRLHGACFSPLQPRLGNFSLEDSDAVESTDDAYSSDTQEVLRATLTFFHGWAELAWATTADDTALLDHGLISAYKRYGIDFDTTAADLKPDHYPIMQDLKECYEQLVQQANDPARKRAYQRFADKAEQCCEQGVYGNLWAHRSNVDVTSDSVVFDTYKLMEAEGHIRTAQLFSILSWVWSQACVSRVTQQFLRLFIDEGHLIFGGGSDKLSVLAAAYVNMIQKRIRKYFGGLMFATQQLNDTLAEGVRRYGESLITSSAYKFFLGTNTTDLKLLKEIMDFTPTIETLIGSRFRRGDCLLCAGSEKVQIHIEALPFEIDLFNTDLRKTV